MASCLYEKAALFTGATCGEVLERFTDYPECILQPKVYAYMSVVFTQLLPSISKMVR